MGANGAVPAAHPKNGSPAIGRLLREWRARRGRSQLDLAHDASTTTRYLSFIETGRSVPSREMVLRLAEVLDVPLRERNALLESAGYARLFPESRLGDGERRELHRVLAFALDRHEPFPAVVIDGCWDVVLRNRAAERFLGALLDPLPRWAVERANSMRLLFHPDGMRRVMVNWEEVARALIRHVHHAHRTGGCDPRVGDLLREITSYPGVPEPWTTPDLSDAPAPFVAAHLRRGDLDVKVVSMLTVVARTRDVAISELSIESFVPADEASVEILRRLGGG
jgi:transcriptional regulator with XRE-family HTH domain